MHNSPIKRQYSKTLDFIHWFLLILINAAVVFGWWVSLLPTLLCLCLLISINWIGYYTRRQQITLQDPRSIFRIEPPVTGTEWQLWQTNGICQMGYLAPNSIRLSWVILLHFKLIGGGKRVVLFFPSQLVLETYKRLQRYVRFEYEHIND